MRGRNRLISSIGFIAMALRIEKMSSRFRNLLLWKSLDRKPAKIILSSVLIIYKDCYFFFLIIVIFSITDL